MGNNCLWSGKSPYFTLSFSFQINILVKISIGLLQNLCGSLNEKFLSDQSSSLKEMLRRWMKWSLDEISGSLVQKVIFPPLQRTSLSREGLGCNWKQSTRSYRWRLQQAADTFECIYTNTFTSKVSSGLDKPSPKLLGQDKPRLEQAVGWISRAGRRFCNIYTAWSCKKQVDGVRWLNTVLRAVRGNTSDGARFKLDKQTNWRRKKQWYTGDDFSKSPH